MARRMSSCDDAFYAPLFEIWVSFRVKRSSHAPSDSPVTAACTAQKLLLNACEIVVYGENIDLTSKPSDIYVLSETGNCLLEQIMRFSNTFSVNLCIPNFQS